MRSALSPRAAGFAWAALTVAIFAGWFAVTRLAVTRNLGIWDVAALRFGIGAVLLSPSILRVGARPTRAQWREGFVFALLWGLPFVALVALGLRLTSAAHAAAIAPTSMPVFAAMFAWVFLGEHPGRRRLLGFACIVAGIAGLALAGAAGQGAPDPLGIAALAGASAMWAVYTLLFKRSALSAIQAAALICLWSAVLFLPFYFALGLSRFAFASPGEIAFQALYQGVLMSAVALVTFNRAVSLLGAAAASTIVALIPAVAALLAIPVLGESPSALEAATIAIVVAGVLLAARQASPTEGKAA